MEQNKVEILEALNNEKMYSLRGDEVGKMCSPEGNDTCGKRLLTFTQTLLNQKVSAIPGRHKIVFFCLDRLKFVWDYPDGLIADFSGNSPYKF